MNNNLFAETAPPPQSIKISNDYLDDQQISAFKEQLLSTFNKIQPKIDLLEKSLKTTEKNVYGLSSDNNSELNLDLKDLQENIPDVHQISIILSRKIQNISLKAQEASTIAAPKRIRPIIDEFYTFKMDFDQSLKNITKLTQNLHEKIEKMDLLIKSVSEDSKSLQLFKTDIEKAILANKQNSKIIDELKEKLIIQARNDRSKILNDFDQSLTEAEYLVTELESLAEQGLDNSNETFMKLQNDKFDIQTSFDSLSNEIEKTMNMRINELRSRIEKNSQKNDIYFQTYDASLTNDLDRIIEYAADSPAITLLDQIEENKQIEELDALISRIEKLKYGIIHHKYDSPKSLSNITENISKELENKKDQMVLNGRNAQIITAVIDGEKKKVFCFENGTFEIQKEKC